MAVWPRVVADGEGGGRGIGGGRRMGRGWRLLEAVGADKADEDKRGSNDNTNRHIVPTVTAPLGQESSGAMLTVDMQEQEEY